MLLAADVALPRAVWAHGYVQWEGVKMSKTAGTAVSLETAIERHGADALRYFLLREVGFAGDGNFTWERFDARYVADLADTLGNLVSRALSMVHRYRGGTVPRDATGLATPLEQAGKAALDAYRRAMDMNDLQEGAAQLIELAARANRYVEETKPWALAKTPERSAELDTVLANLIRTVARLAGMAAPFMPEKAAMIWQLLGTGTAFDRLSWGALSAPAVEGRVVEKPPVLFPKPVAGA